MSLKQKILKRHNIFTPTVNLNKLGYDISQMSIEAIAYYSQNPGYLQNLMLEKEALLIEEPKISHINNGDPARKKNETQINNQNNGNGQFTMRFIYAVLGVKSSFDSSEIDSRRFTSEIWLKHGNDIANGFGFEDIIIDEPLSFEEVYHLVDSCIHKWSGGCLHNENGIIKIQNNGFPLF